FVDGKKANLHVAYPLFYKITIQTFGGEIKKLDPSVYTIIQRNVHLPTRHTRKNSNCFYTLFPQVLDLIFHQRNKRTHHNTYTCQLKRRHLKTNRSPSTGRH